MKILEEVHACICKHCDPAGYEKVLQEATREVEAKFTEKAKERYQAKLFEENGNRWAKEY